jgi:predicted acylesterase/phospholipase RssA
MPSLNISGRVIHGIFVGTVAPPCAGATVQVYDRDQGGNGDDLIWTGTTNANGEFSGTTSEWMDLNTVRIGFSSLPVPDVLLLKAVVTQQMFPTGTNRQEFQFPQAVLPSTSSPLVVPWASPTPVTPPVGFYTPLPTVAPQNLIDGTFKGGGSLGAAYCGALLAMARNGRWFKRVAGNSAGAITASLIAAGYNANELDFLFTPLDTPKVAPTGFPASLHQSEVDYRKFVDPPLGPNDISQDTKRNNLLFLMAKGAALDTVLNARVNLPDLSSFADTVVQKVLDKVPTSVGPFSNPLGPGQVGPFGFSLSPGQKNDIRGAVQDALSGYPTSLSLSSLNLYHTEPLRTAFADAVIDLSLRTNPLYLLWLNFAGDGGLLNGDAFLGIIKRLLEAKLGRSPVRFSDLPIELTVIGSDTTDHKMMVYSSKTGFASMEVAEAVRRSMSIPFIYEPRVDNGHEIMDGGLVDNYPFWVHLTNQTAEDMARVKVGFLLDSSTPAPAAWNCPDSSHRNLNLAAFRADGLVDSLTHSTGSTNPLLSGNLIEARLLNRLVNEHATHTETNPLYTALRDIYTHQPNVSFYEAVIPLNGFFWLDFFIDRSTYNGMASRGWEAAREVIQSKNLAVGTAVTTNPYR